MSFFQVLYNEDFYLDQSKISPPNLYPGTRGFFFLVGGEAAKTSREAASKKTSGTNG